MISNNKLTLVVTNKSKEEDSVMSLLSKTNRKICYVCLTRSHADVKRMLEKKGINCERIVFIDAIYSGDKCEPGDEKCTFISGLENLDLVQKQLNSTIKKYHCDTVIFDSISSLLIYQKANDILKFTHTLVSDEIKKKVNKIYLVLKEKGIYQKDINKLLDDLLLFADKRVEH